MEHQQEGEASAATSQVLVSAAPGVGAEAPEESTTSSAGDAAQDTTATEAAPAAAPVVDDGNSSTNDSASSSESATSAESAPASTESSATGTKRPYEETQVDHSAHSGTDASAYGGYGHQAGYDASGYPTNDHDAASSAKRTRTEYDAHHAAAAGAYGAYDPAAYAQAAAAYDYSAHQAHHHQQAHHPHQQAHHHQAMPAAAVPAAAPAAPAAPQEPLPESLAEDPPSKVIHFRNVTSEITQEDMIELATPFGAVEKVVMMATKNQALLEFRDLAGAILMSNFYINTQPLIRGRKVYMRFSRHQALNTSSSSINRVLLITLSTESDPVIPITADIVWQIFSSYGFIERIVVINKNGLQALVQYQSPVAAQTALQYLNGKTVYVGTDPILPLTLYIQYSHLQQLTIKHNSASARDYTTPLPWNMPQQPAYPGYGGYPPPGGGYGAPPPPHYGGGYGGMPPGGGGYGGGYGGEYNG